MSTYLPAVFSTVRPDAFDRQIDHMFEEALSAFGSAGGHGFQPVTRGKIPMVSISKWRCQAGSPRMWL